MERAGGIIIAAITLSATAYTQPLPEGFSPHLHLRTFATVAELHYHRIEALLTVRAAHYPWCVYLDDDDALPDDAPDVYAECMRAANAANAAMAHTDEYVFIGNDRLRATYIHHGVLMRTTTAQAVAKTLPLGLYHTEKLLYPALAKHGSVYVPRVGYHWHKKATGMHTKSQILEAQINADLWHQRQPTAVVPAQAGTQRL